jgi:recombination protein RecR
MSGTIEPIARMVNQLSKLPGVGAKTAQRLAYHIISLPEEQVRELAVAIFNGKKQTKFCSVCGNYSTDDVCGMCRDDDRKNGQLCVVKDPRDVAAMERMREYNGLYHVLHGVISPMQGIGPDAIRIPPYIVLPAVMIPMLFVALVILLILYRKPKRRPSLEEVVETVEQSLKQKEEEK